MAIRDVRVGIEAVYGTAATTYVFMRVNDLQPKNLAPLEKTKETSGTTITFQRGRLKGRQFDFTIKTYGYHDMNCYLMALAYGAPTITPAFVTAFKHSFLPGGLSLKSATMEWKQVSSAGVLWFQAAGCKVKTVKTTIDANACVLWEFTGHGKYAKQIAAPAAVSDTTAAYIQPVDMSQQSITLNALPWPDPPKKFEVTVDNGLTPDWIIAATRDFNRLKLGDTTGKATVDAFFDIYTGSMTDTEDNSASDMLPIVYLGVDLVSTIGTAGHPSTTLTFPNPFVDSVTQDNTSTDTEEKGSIEFAYDQTLGSLMNYEFVNMLIGSGAGSIYTGT